MTVRINGKQTLPITARSDSSHLDMTVVHILDGTGLADGDEDGLIDDVWIYSYALSEGEIKALYAGKGPGPTKD